MKITKARLKEIIKEELGLNTPSLEEADMRTRAERYGRNDTEISYLEDLNAVFADAQQSVHVDAEVLRAFLMDLVESTRRR